MNEISKLLSYCIGQTAKGNHCFLNYFGHTNDIYITAYNGKWSEKSEPIFYRHIDIKCIDAEKVICEIENALNSVQICI